MRKPFLVFVALLGSVTGLIAQDADFGVTAGFMNARGSVKVDGESFSGDESGFYAGIVADFTLADKVGIQPELLYASVDGGDGLLLPVMFKYYVAPKVNFQAGPQFVFSLEELPDDISGIEFDLAGGLGVDIIGGLFAEARYSFQLNNSYTGPEDIKIRGNYLTIGVGYTF